MNISVGQGDHAAYILWIYVLTFPGESETFTEQLYHAIENK